MTKKAEFERCLDGLVCSEKECLKLRDYWGYSLGFEFTIEPVSVASYDFIFTITNPTPKQYGW